MTIFKNKWKIRAYTPEDTKYITSHSHVELNDSSVIDIETYIDSNANLEKKQPVQSFWMDSNWNSLEMITFCSLYNHPGCQNKFSHVITDRGICSAFNSVTPANIYNPSVYVNHFQEVFTSSQRLVPFLNSGSGQNNKLDLILDIHQTNVFGSESGHFLIALNSFEDVFSTASGIEIFPGPRSQILVNTIVVEADQNVQEFVAIEDRNCTFQAGLPVWNNFRSKIYIFTTQKL